MLGCDYNGWADLPEDVREALDQLVTAEFAAPSPRRRPSAGTPPAPRSREPRHTLAA